MKSFKDAGGRTWQIAIDVSAIKRLKNSPLGINLLEVVEKDSNLIERLAAPDPILLVDILYVLCEEQAKQASISDEQFGSAMRGDPIDEASRALLEEIADFFPKGKRQVLLKAIEKIGQIQGKANEAAMTWLNSGALEQEIEKQLKEISGSLPASSVSTPDRSPSES